MNKLIKRTITGAVYVAVVVASLVWSLPYLYLAIFALTAALGVNELHNLASLEGQSAKAKLLIRIIDIVGSILIFASTAIATIKPGIDLVLCASLVTPWLLVRMVSQIYIRNTNHIRDMALSALAIVYVAAPLALLNILYVRIGNEMLLATFILLWVNDTGAYCVGMPLGRHKLFPRISPKKSWEGFWGGLVFCIIISLIFDYFGYYFGDMGIFYWIGFAIVVAVFATWGDLCESLIKRTVGAKDSSNLLPGHGGILDRIDSLLIVIPAIMIYITLFSLL